MQQIVLSQKSNNRDKTTNREVKFIFLNPDNHI